MSARLPPNEIRDDRERGHDHEPTRDRREGQRLPLADRVSDHGVGRQVVGVRPHPRSEGVHQRRERGRRPRSAGCAMPGRLCAADPRAMRDPTTSGNSAKLPCRFAHSAAKTGASQSRAGMLVPPAVDPQEAANSGSARSCGSHRRAPGEATRNPASTSSEAVARPSAGRAGRKVDEEERAPTRSACAAASSGQPPAR